ncbi:hypothetical protein [Haliangium sp.]
MKYTIIESPDYTQVSRIGVSTEPDSDPLKFFLSSIRLERFPTLLLDAANKEGYPGDPGGLTFHGDLDGEDFAAGDGFEPGQVKVYHHVFGDAVLSEDIFLHILYDYACAVLAEYRDDAHVDEDWAARMTAAIEALGKTLPLKSPEWALEETPARR